MFLVAGIPRASTTLVAKLMSLTDQAFCYAGETHLIPFLHKYFQHLPCHPAKVDHILDELGRILNSTMIEAPRYNVKNGAHPGNLIFDERHVNHVLDRIGPLLKDGMHGKQLFIDSLAVLESVLAQVSDRNLLGEKTPDNLFALACYGHQVHVDNLVVVREPMGVLRSMQTRVDKNDPYSGVFSGGVESNIGIYLESLKAVQQISAGKNCCLVRFEDLANHPADTVKRMYAHFNLNIDHEIQSFVENGGNQVIADMAPMYYQRLKLKTDCSDMSNNDLWKILNFTQGMRNKMGYSDRQLEGIGFKLSDIAYQGTVKDGLIALYGFNVPDISPSRIWNKKVINRWMKGDAKMVLYVEKIRKLNLTLNFMSAFPENLQSVNKVSLTITINDLERDQITVGTGLKKSSLTLSLNKADFSPIGSQSGYAMIDLAPGLSFCPAAHSENNWDTRVLSFQLINWTIKNT